MQNRRMHLATTMVFFRTHTRVLLTLAVSLAITILSLTGRNPAALSDCAVPPEKSAPQTAASLKPAQSELPRTVIRLFFLLPYLIPHDN